MTTSSTKYLSPAEQQDIITLYETGEHTGKAIADLLQLNYSYVSTFLTQRKKPGVKAGCFNVDEYKDWISNSGQERVVPTARCHRR
jgi:hypothetical protein